jgi:Glycosyl transferase family 90
MRRLFADGLLRQASISTGLASIASGKSWRVAGGFTELAPWQIGRAAQSFLASHVRMDDVRLYLLDVLKMYSALQTFEVNKQKCFLRSCLLHAPPNEQRVAHLARARQCGPRSRIDRCALCHMFRLERSAGPPGDMCHVIAGACNIMSALLGGCWASAGEAIEKCNVLQR